MSQPLDLLFRVSPGLLAVIRDGCFVLANPAWTRVLGWSTEELLGTATATLVHPDDVARAATLLDGGLSSVTAELRVRTKEGTYRLLHLEGRGDAGNIYLAGSDITDQRALEEAMRRQNEMFVESQSIGAIGSWTFDPVARRITWSEEMFRLFGSEMREAPSYEEHLRQIHPDDLGRWRHEVEGATERGNDYEIEFRALLPDGSTRDVLGHGRCRKDAAGRVVWMGGTVQDITSRKAFERELLATREAAIAASRAKSTFLATMSHEIRTPLFGIQGTAALLADSGLSPDQRELVGTLRASADALLGIINDILDFSKVEAGKMTLEERPFEVRALLEGALEIVRPLAREKGLALGAEIDPSVPAELVGDDGRIRQVLLNLLSNALKFTKRGAVSLRVRAEKDRGRAVLVASIDDTGIGITPDDLARLFSDFSQLERGATRRFQGTGLGLAISKRLAELMGGGIEVTSAVGRGSTFTASFALGTVGARPAEVSPGLPSFVPSPRKLRVLVAEDNAVNQMLVRRQLQKHGHEVVVVANGLDAVTALDRGAFDAVLMDCHMPELDGYEATRRIRSRGDLKAKTPILALTASVLEDDRRACADAGMDGFLTKPISDRELAAAMANISRRDEPPPSSVVLVGLGETLASPLSRSPEAYLPVSSRGAGSSSVTRGTPDSPRSR